MTPAPALTGPYSDAVGPGLPDGSAALLADLDTAIATLRGLVHEMDDLAEDMEDMKRWSGRRRR